MVKLEGFFFILRASVNDLMHSIHFHIFFTLTMRHSFYTRFKIALIHENLKVQR